MGAQADRARLAQSSPAVAANQITTPDELGEGQAPRSYANHTHRVAYALAIRNHGRAPREAGKHREAPHWNKGGLTVEIDITDFVRLAEPADFSASAFELGDDAGRITWRNAVKEGTDSPILTTPEQLDALRDHVREFGAWDDAEIAAWSDAECNALFVQLISGDLRELENCCADDNGEIDWTEAQRQSEAGRIGGRIYPCDVPGHKDTGRIFYYLGV